MVKTLGEVLEFERNEIYKRSQKRKEELKKDLKTGLESEELEVLSIGEGGEGLRVEVAFTLDGYRQEDTFYWNKDESKDEFIESVKRRIDYIKELREKYPDYCKQNDYIQSNRIFVKNIVLTHMGYKREFSLKLKLADYLKLPNTTDCSFGGGDYEIKRTPERVKEYNRNIDIAIDALIDCIAELKKKKYIEYHDYDWLIEQAERSQELDEELKVTSDAFVRANKKLLLLDRQNKRYREALEFYANEGHAMHSESPDEVEDYREVARKALEAIE